MFIGSEEILVWCVSPGTSTARELRHSTLSDDSVWNGQCIGLEVTKPQNSNYLGASTGNGSVLVCLQQNVCTRGESPQLEGTGLFARQAHTDLSTGP